MKWHTEMSMQLRGADLDDDRFDALADALYELDALDPAIEDTDLTACLADGRVIVSMVADAADLEAAVHKAVAAVRTAIHKLGDGTPGWAGWEDSASEPALSVRPAGARRFAEV